MATVYDYTVQRRRSDGIWVNSNILTTQLQDSTTPNPTDPTGRVTLWAVGDGDNTTESQGVVNLILANGLSSFEKLLYLGDIYQNGTVAEWAEWARNWGRVPETQRFHCFGNHEYENGNSSVIATQVPSSMGPNGVHYREITLSNGWKVISVNSSSPNLTTTGPNYTFLRDRLAATPGTAKIVIWHKPAWSADDPNIAGGHGDLVAMQAFTRLCVGRAALILCGHDHAMNLFQPYNGTAFVAPAAGVTTDASVHGVTQAVIGNGGHGLYTHNPNKAGLEFGYSAGYGASRVTLENDRATIEFIRSDGTILKTKTVQASFGTATPPGGGGGTPVPTDPRVESLDVEFSTSPEPQIITTVGAVAVSAGTARQSVTPTTATSEFRIARNGVLQRQNVLGQSVCMVVQPAQIASGTGEVFDALTVALDETARVWAQLRRHYDNRTAPVRDLLEFRVVENNTDAGQRSYPYPAGLKAIGLGFPIDGRTVIPMYSTDYDSTTRTGSWIELGDPNARRQFPTASVANTSCEIAHRLTQTGTGTASVSVTDRIFGRNTPFAGTGTGPTIKNEVQTVTLPSGITGGTWTGSWGAGESGALEVTTAISATATAAAVQSAFIDSLTDLIAGDLTVTGANGGPYTFTFAGRYAGRNLMEVTTAHTFTGTVAPIAVSTTQEGGSITYPGSIVRRFDGVDDRLSFPLPAGATGQIVAGVASNVTVDQFPGGSPQPTHTLSSVPGVAGDLVIVEIQTNTGATLQTSVNARLAAQTFTTNGWTHYKGAGLSEDGLSPVLSPVSNGI